MTISIKSSYFFICIFIFDVLHFTHTFLSKESQIKNTESLERYLSNNHLTKIEAKPPTIPLNSKPPASHQTLKTNTKTQPQSSNTTLQKSKLPVKQSARYSSPSKEKHVNNQEDETKSPKKKMDIIPVSILKKPLASQNEKFEDDLEEGNLNQYNFHLLYLHSSFHNV